MTSGDAGTVVVDVTTPGAPVVPAVAAAAAAGVAAPVSVASLPNPLSLLPCSMLPGGGSFGGGRSGNGHGDVIERRGGLKVPQPAATGVCRPYTGWMVAGAVEEVAEGVAPQEVEEPPEGIPVAEEAAEETPEEEDPASPPRPLPGEPVAGSRLGCNPR